MNNAKEIIMELYAQSDDVLFADGFDDAIIGFDPNLWKVVYSRYKVIRIIFENSQGMTEQEAIEFAEYNIFGAYMGEKTPVWAEDFTDFNI